VALPDIQTVKLWLRIESDIEADDRLVLAMIRAVNTRGNRGAA